MNRQQLHNPKLVDQKTIERGIDLIISALNKGIDPKLAVEACMIRLCDHDQRGARDLWKILGDTSKMLSDLMDEVDRLRHRYEEADFELSDNPIFLSLCDPKSGAAGASDGGFPSLPPSFDSLPPAIRGHCVRRHSVVDRANRKALDRMRFDGEYTLAQALEDELNDRNATASEHADAASNGLVVEQASEDARFIQDQGSVPLISLGQGEYRREIGGE